MVVAAPAPIGEKLGEGIFRYFKDPDAQKNALPSFALKAPRAAIGPAPASAKVSPVFDISPEKRERVRITIEPGTSLYGGGESAGPLLRNGRVTECWNTDAYGYTEENKSLYQSHPWILAVRPDGTAFGVLADTTWRCEIDLRDGITFAAVGPAFPVIVIDRASPKDVLMGLGELIGGIPLPPMWAIGYHQCRYSYNPEARVREIAKGFRDRKIPCDVIWFDIDYMNEYRVFTFDSKQFPDPKKLNADLGSMGFHRIWMIDPGIKQETGYAVHDSGLAGDHYVKTPKGEDYRGEVWPGYCVFPDYTRPETRTWWAGLYKDFMAQGVNGVWNDMNEPAVFNVATKTMPEDNHHRGGGDLTPGPHARYHNVYGNLMAGATYDGIKAANPDVRPFVLTRAGYIGSHRVAATWTGDNSAQWKDVEDSVSMVLNLGISGQPFCGPDIGGFNGNGPADEKERKLFYSRWFGFGVMLPFARGHTGKGNINKEPWSFGPEVEKTITLGLQRRYRLLPYYYTLFEESSRTGLPVARPLFMADSRDLALRSERGAFMLGDDLILLTKATPLGDRVPALPKGIWRDVEVVPEAAGDPNLPAMKARGGSIIPAGPIIEHTGQRTPLDPLTLIVCLDAQGNASGSIYEDAGEGYAYQKGQFRRSFYKASRQGDTVRVTLEKSEGEMTMSKRPLLVRVLHDAGEASATGTDGEVVEVALKPAR